MAGAHDPFFTTRPASRVGLGLSTAHAIAHQYGGGLDLSSSVGEGTTVLLRWPLHEVE